MDLGSNMQFCDQLDMINRTVISIEVVTMWTLEALSDHSATVPIALVYSSDYLIHLKSLPDQLLFLRFIQVIFLIYPFLASSTCSLHFTIP